MQLVLKTIHILLKLINRNKLLEKKTKAVQKFFLQSDDSKSPKNQKNISLINQIVMDGGLFL